jgi:hypothetical protein
VFHHLTALVLSESVTALVFPPPLRHGIWITAIKQQPHWDKPVQKLSYVLLLISTHHVTDYLIVAKSDDAHVEELIRDYDRRNIVNKETVHKMLLAEHGINMRYDFTFAFAKLFVTLCEQSQNRCTPPKSIWATWCWCNNPSNAFA